MVDGIIVDSHLLMSFDLNMQSMVWTKIHTGQTSPQARCCHSFNAVTDKQLVLYGGEPDGGITLDGNVWIFDLPTLTWMQYGGNKLYDYYDHFYHTSNNGINDRVIIIGGFIYHDLDELHLQIFSDHLIINVPLEPKSLQQLAIQKVYKHRSTLPWTETLPKSLLAQFMFPATVEDDGDE